MKTTPLILALSTLASAAIAGPEPLSNGQAYLAATLAALSTPKMKDAPIQVNAAIRKASGVQEDAGAVAIVAIPDESADAMDISQIAETNVPLCRLWMKGSVLKLPAKSTARIEQKEVDAEGEKHSVTIWLLGLRQTAKGKPELIVCATQKEPALVLPLKALTVPEAADPDAPVRVSVEQAESGPQLVLTLRGTHEVRLPLE